MQKNKMHDIAVTKAFLFLLCTMQSMDQKNDAINNGAKIKANIIIITKPPHAVPHCKLYSVTQLYGDTEIPTI